MDIVRVFANYSTLKGFIYSHGRKSNLNLLKSDLNENQVYFLNEPTTREQEKNDLGTRVKSMLYKGNAFLLKKSDLDQQYFKEKNTNDTDSKFTKNIEPLIKLSIDFENYLLCAGFDIVSFGSIEVVNVLDTNKDGLLITYQIRQDV